MALTRKAFLLRAGAATAGVVATSLAGAGTADAIIIVNSRLQSVLELTTNAARQLTRIAGEFPPGPCRPETQAQLAAVLAASADLSATASRLLEGCQPPR